MATSDLIPEHPTTSVHNGNIADELARGHVCLQVVVVSPQGTIFEGDAHWVTLTASDGQLGIWPRHVTMVAALGGGPLRIGLPNHDVLRFVTYSGFVSVAADTVTILVDKATTKDEIDEAEAKRELDEATAALRHPRSDAEFAALLDKRAWSVARIAVANE